MVDTLFTPLWAYEFLSGSVNLPSAQSSQKKISVLFMYNAILFTDTPIVTPITIPAPHTIMSCTVCSIHFVKKVCFYTHQS